MHSSIAFLLYAPRRRKIGYINSFFLLFLTFLSLLQVIVPFTVPFQLSFRSSSSSSSCISSSSSNYDTIRSAKVIDTNGHPTSPLLPFELSSETVSSPSKKTLVVILPQLGEFDSSEICEQLAAISDDLYTSNVDLRVVGVGQPEAAERFCRHTGLDSDRLFLDPDASLHRALGLHEGPGWSFPAYVSNDVLRFILGTLPGGVPDGYNEGDLRETADAWGNYLGMCAGIAAPGTLREIFRGYVGDSNAPERFGPTDVVTVGAVEIGPGVGPVRLGPLRYENWWSDEAGYQRPVELATVRLRNMVEVLGNWNSYVSDPRLLAVRGATFLFDENDATAVEELYFYRHPGVLTYSETMSRPLSFLAPYLGKNDAALNPLGLGDNGGGDRPGRGLLKGAGKIMTVLGPVFRFEAKLQARLLPSFSNDGELETETDAAIAATTSEIERTVLEHDVVLYSYSLSPFSSEAGRVLDAAISSANGAATTTNSDEKKFHTVEVGMEWFLLGREGSILRAALLDITGQSSLPQVFIGGKFVGGLFSGGEKGGMDNSDEKENNNGGIAALQESGKLVEMLRDVKSA